MTNRLYVGNVQRRTSVSPSSTVQPRATTQLSPARSHRSKIPAPFQAKRFVEERIIGALGRMRVSHMSVVSIDRWIKSEATRNRRKHAKPRHQTSNDKR